MEYIYSAMLLHKAGKQINEDAVTAVLKAAGVSVDITRVKALVAALANVNIEEAIKKAAITAPVAAVSAPAAHAHEAKKEEKKEDGKKAEEAAAAGLGALFG